jgi:hypothetical protein
MYQQAHHLMLRSKLVIANHERGKYGGLSSRHNGHRNEMCGNDNDLNKLNRTHGLGNNDNNLAHVNAKDYHNNILSENGVFS